MQIFIVPMEPDETLRQQAGIGCLPTVTSAGNRVIKTKNIHPGEAATATTARQERVRETALSCSMLTPRGIGVRNEPRTSPQVPG